MQSPSPRRSRAPCSEDSSASGSTTRRRAPWTSSNTPAPSTAGASSGRRASSRSSASRTSSRVSATETVTQAVGALTRTATEVLPETIFDLQRQIEARIRRIPTRLNAYGYDPWGFHPDTARRAMLVTALLYRYWFRVETQGIANIPPGRVLLIGNHAGQIALDAAMISCACLLEAEPPRVVRGMGEYWLPSAPSGSCRFRSSTASPSARR